MSATYRFLPWVRQGAATAVRTVDTLSAGVPLRPQLPVAARVNRRVDVDVSLRMYGPGDVVGFDPRIVVRSDPPHLSTGFEPNYFPAVDFSVPGIPWALTPATGDARGRLRPWLVLVVVRRQPGVTLASEAGRPLPVLRIESPAEPAAELPDLAESWAWAHTQTLSTGAAEIREMLGAGDGVVSRLLCPRRLRPGAAYLACLVPAFAAGRRAGLAELPDPGETELTPAWVHTELGDRIELPVYLRWEFATGTGGDFESLARRLRGRPLPEGVGSRPLRLGDAGVGLPDGGLVSLDGILRPPGGTAQGALPGPFITALRELINTPASLRGVGGDEEPIVAPPMYGSWQAAYDQIDDAAPRWLRELNTDPRRRVAAGLATIVVQDQQEALMASAWAQLGEVTHVRDRLPRRELGRTVLARVHEGLRQLSPERLLRVTAPLHGRVRMEATPTPAGGGAPIETRAVTVRERIRASALPLAVVSSSFRRVTRPTGPVVRKLPALAGDAPTAPVRPLAFTARFAAPRAAVATSRAIPAGATVSAAEIDARVKALVVLSTQLAEASRFNAAARELGDYLAQRVGGGSPPSRPVLPLAEVRAALLNRLEPAETLPPLATPPLPPREEAPAPAPLATELSEPTIPGPSFPQPMYEFLRELAPDLLLPGIDRIPADSVTLMETNPAMIESFMIGLNHEMCRELLWREYPSDLRGTPFRHFWGGGEVMPEVHRWTSDEPLGEHLSAGSDDRHLVLLIRGELLQRYPRTVVYATRSAAPGAADAEKRFPRFRAALGPDATCLGFDLTASEARGGAGDPGWFFVFEQPAGQPRFGLDETPATGRDPAVLASWNEVGWGDVVDDEAAFERLSHVPLAGRLTGHRVDALEWGLNAGHMAAITLQRPVRVVIPATTLLDPEEEPEPEKDDEAEGPEAPDV